MTEYIIRYGEGRPGGNIERRTFETYNDAYRYAADNAHGWGFGITLAAEEEQPSRDDLDENTAHCKRIAEELDAYVHGNVRRCPDCGEEINRDWDSVGDQFKCPACGAVDDPDDWEYLSVWDYLNDVYNVEFRMNGRSCDDYRSVQIMVACGGPNIYLDTATKDVELYWWNERARWPMSYAAAEALDEWAVEYWGCL